MKITSFKMVPAIVMLSMTLLAGCGGGDSVVKSSSTTMGQELTDLKKAYDQGIISEREYERSKEKIMDKYD